MILIGQIKHAYTRCRKFKRFQYFQEKHSHSGFDEYNIIMADSFESLKKGLDQVAADLSKFDTDKNVRLKWNSQVMNYIGDIFGMFYEINGRGQLEAIAELRKASLLNSAGNGGDIQMATLPPWKDFIPDEPLPMECVLATLNERLTMQGKVHIVTHINTYIHTCIHTYIHTYI